MLIFSAFFFIVKGSSNNSLHFAAHNMILRNLTYVSCPFLKAFSCTIYHLGVDREKNEIVGYRYRSENLFNSENLNYSIGIKPNYEKIIQDVKDNPTQNVDIPAIISLITKLKDYDDKLDIEERIGIGGEIHLVILNKDGTFLIKRIHQFSDYDQNFSEMLKNKNIREYS